MASTEDPDPADPSTWPPEFDALRAAPEHHTLVFENERVRVLETRIRPGEITRVHTHCWPAVLHILSRSAMVRRDARGHVTFDSRIQPATGAPPASVAWTGPFPLHTLENVGDRDIHVLAVEIKQSS